MISIDKRSEKIINKYLVIMDGERYFLKEIEHKEYVEYEIVKEISNLERTRILNAMQDMKRQETPKGVSHLKKTR